MLFYWSSSYLESYRYGHIIVEAETVEEARGLARKAFEEHAPEHNYKDIEDLRKEFENDLSVEPNIQSEYGGAHLYKSVIFIDGDDG